MTARSEKKSTSAARPIAERPAEQPAAAAEQPAAATPAPAAGVCVVDDGRCVGRAVNGKVCSYHAVSHDRHGRRRA